MKKKIAKIGALVATTGAIFALTTGSVDAHHPEVLVTSVCIEPDESFLNITAMGWEYWDDGTPVTPDRRTNPLVRVYISNSPTTNSWLLIGEGHFGADNNYSFDVNTVQKNAVGSVTVRVVSVAPWGINGEYKSFGDTREAVIDLSDDCASTTTTSKLPVVTTTSKSPVATVPTGTTPPSQATIVRDSEITPPSQTTIVRDRETPPAISIAKTPNFTG
jgi:hypothetical protein